MIKFVFVLSAISLISFLNAQRVSHVEIRTVAENHILLKGENQSVSSSQIIKDVLDKEELFYLFHLNPQGYIIVSSNKSLPPVVAYSFINNPDKEGRLVSLLKYDIGLRLSQIDQLPTEIKEKYNESWNNILSGEAIKGKNQVWPPAGTTSTGGWLETNWSQQSPYKDMCPWDPVNAARSVAGCPAVAMGMIINYHKTTNNVFFDDNDDYYHNYAGRQYWIDNDYDNYGFPAFSELNTYLDTLDYHYKNSIPLTNEDKASLVFACGVACKQVYTSSISGTFGVAQALNAYYKFNFNNIDILYDGDTSIQNRLINNIVNALPAHLALVDSNQTVGHNVVVDGYDTDGFFHINFGWGGTSNGWYVFPAGIPYNLTVVEGIIIDIDANNTTSNEEVYTSGKIFAYPNPFNNEVRLLFENLYDVVNVKVFNIAGQLIFSAGFNNTDRIILEINEVPGCYFVKVTTPDLTKTLKLIRL